MKTRTAWLWIVIAIVAILLCAGCVASRMNISALDSPGRLETRLSTFAKHQLVARQAARMHIAEPAPSEASANIGQVLFSVECATCHGKDGRSPTHIGQSMYPRVPDLGSTEIQSWSDPQLFWIIENGVRLAECRVSANSIPTSNCGISSIAFAHFPVIRSSDASCPLLFLSLTVLFTFRMS